MRRDECLGRSALSGRHVRPILLQLGVRPCEDERPLPCAARASPSSARIAVYTYNLGGYEEPRKKQVPCATRCLRRPRAVDQGASGGGCLPLPG